MGFPTCALKGLSVYTAEDHHSIHLLREIGANLPLDQLFI